MAFNGEPVYGENVLDPAVHGDMVATLAEVAGTAGARTVLVRALHTGVVGVGL